MTNQLATKDTTYDTIESVIVVGDIAKLSPAQRVAHYIAVCKSTGLNPLTKPFDYITLQGKMVLYARKDATDQLRRMNGVSIVRLERETIGDVYCVTAYAEDMSDRKDSSIGAVSIAGLEGDALANAMMKAETKAKRRVTLSICGLGWLDETEIETIPGATKVVVDDAGHIDSDDAPSAKAWAAYKKLAEEAEALGIAVPAVPQDVTTAQLREYYGNIKSEMKAIRKD